MIGGAQSAAPTGTPVAVTAPSVGTVSCGDTHVGQRVSEGEVVARLRVLDTEIGVVATASGRVAAMLTEDGALVGYGTELFLIAPETAP